MATSASASASASAPPPPAVPPPEQATGATATFVFPTFSGCGDVLLVEWRPARSLATGHAMVLRVEVPRLTPLPVTVELCREDGTPFPERVRVPGQVVMNRRPGERVHMQCKFNAFRAVIDAHVPNTFQALAFDANNTLLGSVCFRRERTLRHPRRRAGHVNASPAFVAEMLRRGVRLETKACHAIKRQRPAASPSPRVVSGVRVTEDGALQLQARAGESGCAVWKNATELPRDVVESVLRRLTEIGAQLAQ